LKENFEINIHQKSIDVYKRNKTLNPVKNERKKSDNGFLSSKQVFKISSKSRFINIHDVESIPVEDVYERAWRMVEAAAQKAFENKSHISIDLLALAFPPKHLNADDLCTVFGITTELSLDLRRARIRQLLIRWYVTYLCFCSLLKKLSSNQCTSGILINFSSHLGV
jgi:hypothetical protein